LIDLDRERCILCARCVRFEDEIAGDPVLGFANRGRSWMIISKSDPPFNSKFSGNTTDICPVGALMSHDFRFAGRVWEVKPVPSICPHCPVGCNITLDMRYRDIKRVQPRENDAVNEIWLCDRGRYGYHFAESDKRLQKPLVRRNGVLVETTWAEAIAEIAQRLSGIARGASSGVIGGIASGRLANEDLYLFQKLFREVLQSSNIDSRSGAADDAEHDDLAYAFGVGSGTELGKLGKGTAVLVVGADPEEEAPIHLLRLRGIQRRGGDLIVANARPTKLGASASREVRYRYGDEELFVFGLLSAILDAGLENKDWANERVRGLDTLRKALQPYGVAEMARVTGIGEDVLRGVAETVAKAENLVIVYGREAQASGTALLQALGNLLLITGHAGRPGNGVLPILRYSNSRGALDMGVRPDKGPGYATIGQRGMSTREMLDGVATGKIRALYVAGADPAETYPQAMLDKLDLLIVQDMFMTPTAEQADYVLPVAAFAEREGTYTNAERRVQRFRQAREATGESRPDWQIFASLGRALVQQEAAAEPVRVGGGRSKGQAVATAPAPQRWVYRSTEDINSEIVRTVGIYSGAAYAQLRSSGGVWGRQATGEAVFYDGTSYSNTEGIGVQWPSLAEQAKVTFDLVFSQPRRAATTDGQFMLVAIPRLYDGGTLMQASELLQFWVAQPYVGVNRDDAARLGLTSGDTVRLTSPAGAIELATRIDGDVSPGMLLVPDVETVPLATIQTGMLTSVRLEKVEGA
jgi:NADH-quinone oxidoreductase subunit G